MRIEIEITPQEATEILRQAQQDNMMVDIQFIEPTTRTMLCRRVAEGIVDFIDHGNPDMAQSLRQRLNFDIQKQIAAEADDV
jgi:hypothetical protein